MSGRERRCEVQRVLTFPPAILVHIEIADPWDREVALAELRAAIPADDCMFDESGEHWVINAAHLLRICEWSLRNFPPEAIMLTGQSLAARLAEDGRREAAS